MQPQIPVELQYIILNHVTSIHDLLQVRAASRDLCALATPAAFRNVGAINTRSSATNLRHILESEYLAPHVQELVYEDVMEKTPPAPSPRASHSSAVQHVLASAFLLLDNLPALHTLRLTFHHPSDEAPDLASTLTALAPPGFFLQIALLEAVTSASDAVFARLRHVALDNVLPYYHAVYQSADFGMMLRSVATLRITTASPRLTPHINFGRNSFWGDAMEAIFQSLRASHELMALTLLFSQDHFRSYSRYDFGGYTIPSLRKIEIPDVGVHAEAFIERHEQLEYWSDGKRKWTRELGWCD